MRDQRSKITPPLIRAPNCYVFPLHDSRALSLILSLPSISISIPSGDFQSFPSSPLNQCVPSLYRITVCYRIPPVPLYRSIAYLYSIRLLVSSHVQPYCVPLAVSFLVHCPCNSNNKDFVFITLPTPFSNTAEDKEQTQLLNISKFVFNLHQFGNTVYKTLYLFYTQIYNRLDTVASQSISVHGSGFSTVDHIEFDTVLRVTLGKERELVELRYGRVLAQVIVDRQLNGYGRSGLR